MVQRWDIDLFIMFMLRNSQLKNILNGLIDVDLYRYCITKHATFNMYNIVRYIYWSDCANLEVRDTYKLRTVIRYYSLIYFIAGHKNSILPTILFKVNAA